MIRVIERLALLCMTLVLLVVIPTWASGRNSLPSVAGELEKAARAIERIGDGDWAYSGFDRAGRGAPFLSRSSPVRVPHPTAKGWDWGEVCRNITRYVDRHFTGENVTGVRWFFDSSASSIVSPQQHVNLTQAIKCRRCGLDRPQSNPDYINAVRGLGFDHTADPQR